MGKQRLKIYLLFLWVMALFSAIICGAQNADINLLRHLNLERNRGLDQPMIITTNSVYPIVAAVPLTELIFGYTRDDKKLILSGWQTIGGLGVTAALTFGIKYSVGRPRPFITYPYLQPLSHDRDPSFPSGHTSFAFYTATSILEVSHRWYVVIPAYTWASLVGYSRLHLGMHYPTDVLAGAVVGSGSVLLTHLGTKWLTGKLRIRK